MRTSGLITALGASLLTALTGCYRTTEQPDLAGQDIRLSVLHTSDLHSRLLPYFATPGLIDRGLGLCAEFQPLGGAARMQHLLKRERAKATNRIIHLDSGDCFQGAPIFNQFRGEAEIRTMAEFRPDGVVIGNHEFDLGARNIAFQYGRFGAGAYPLLAANYIFSDPGDPSGNELGALVKPYTIVNLEGLKVAVIGMGNQSSMTSIRQGGNSSGITPLEPVEALRSWVYRLQAEVDLIVIVSHMGLNARQELNLAEDTEMITGYERVVDADAVLPCEYPNPELNCWKKIADEPGGQVRVSVPGISGIDAIFGGHLHIVLNPPKVFTDPSGRQVVLVHSGAFAKFFGRADLVVRMPKRGEPAPFGAEIISHTYELFPITNRIPKRRPTAVIECPDEMGSQTFEIEEGRDAVGLQTQCLPIFAADEQIRVCRKADACRQLGDACTDDCRRARRDCTSVPAPIDPQMIEMLDPYVIELYQNVNLNRGFAFATDRIRRFGLSGEDSELGNMVADSMRFRNRVEAQFALTNTLGIRTNMEAGLVTIEQMFNIFPFENTLTTMSLSGTEVQELFDFVTERSTERGCQTQAQISGATFTMNCAQELRNLAAPECKVAADCDGTDFVSQGRDKPVRCREGRCYKGPADDIRIQGALILPTENYKVAVNDFIARGGSQFEVLRRNTTRFNTGLSLRDALIDYMKLPPSKKGGGPGRVCGSPFMVEPIQLLEANPDPDKDPRPINPLVVVDKDLSPDATCDDLPTGCTPASGRFFDCDDTDDELRFYCIPFDFRDVDSNAQNGNDCEQLAESMRFIETRQVAAGTSNPCPALAEDVPGQVHCCARKQDDGSFEASYYAMASLCIDAPRVGRISRIIQ